MGKKSIFIIAIICLSLVSCAPAYKSAPLPYEEPPLEPAIAEGAAMDREIWKEVEVSNEERLVIKNVSLELIVKDPKTSMDAIGRVAEEFGGHVVNAELYQYFLDNGTEVPRASITIRVLAEHLDEAITKLEAQSDREPQRKTISSQDVTREYTDLQSRLRNLEAAENQLIKVMENTTKTEDILQVYDRLTQIREQIEVIKGEIKYYETSAALSAISVDLIADVAVQPLKIGGWEPVGTAKSAINALLVTLRALSYVAIWLIIFIIPVAAVIILPIFLLVRFVVRRQRRKQKQTPPAA